MAIRGFLCPQWGMFSPIAKSYAEHLAKAYSEGRSGDGLATYNLWKMLAHLEKTGSMTLEKIAVIEFPFARLFRFNGPEGETAIHRVLARDPKQVIELAKARYKSMQQLMKRIWMIKNRKIKKRILHQKLNKRFITF